MNTSTDLLNSEKKSPSYYSNKGKNFIAMLAGSIALVPTIGHSEYDSLYEITSNYESTSYLDSNSPFISNGYEYNSSIDLINSYGSNSSINYLNSLYDTSKKKSPINTAIGRILALGMYEDGWNSSESIKPKSRTVQDAQQLARDIFSKKIVSPTISLSDDGEISFYWDEQEYILDLGVFGDGNYSYYYRDREGNELFADDESIEHILKDKVIGMIEIKDV